MHDFHSDRLSHRLALAGARTAAFKGFNRDISNCHEGNEIILINLMLKIYNESAVWATQSRHIPLHQRNFQLKQIFSLDRYNYTNIFMVNQIHVHFELMVCLSCKKSIFIDSHPLTKTDFFPPNFCLRRLYAKFLRNLFISSIQNMEVFETLGLL